MLRCLLLACALRGGSALDNGLGITPPRGWRSWDAFENSVSQTLQMSQVDALVDRGRAVDGKRTSLLDLGYNRIGLDDAWQHCGPGVNGSFHTALGVPLVKNKTFPSLKAMNAYARSKGIGSGWYLNTCDCCERGQLMPNWPVQMHGDVKAINDLGFDGIKLDSCGPSQHLAEWARLLNASGKPVLLENCFDNASFPFTKSGVDDGSEDVVAEDACPMNIFRSGGDMRADWPLMLRRLQTVVPWLRLSRPGCWAYLDMLEVGNPPGGTGEMTPSLFENAAAWRAHFGAWLIASSPLILSFDLKNETKVNLTWDFITNKEALEINSAWTGPGSAGGLVSSKYDMSAPTPVFGRPCSSSVDTQRFKLTAGGMLKSSGADGRCLSVAGCPTQQALKAEHVRSGNGKIMLTTCVAGKASQEWTLTGDPSNVTDFNSSDGGCWEIDGCGGSSIDTNYGCKQLPKTMPCTGCCNMAWRMLANGTILSGMSKGGTVFDQCLQVSSKDESTIVVGPCRGAKRETFSIVGKTVQSAFGGCIDNAATSPANPQYGNLVVSDCGDDGCGGDTHRWAINARTKQLVSKVKGMGEEICVEVGNYMNHDAYVSGVGCSSTNSSMVKKAQQWTYDAARERISVDVRFDSTQQRSPGQLLCADIDFSALGSGQLAPGSMMLEQVWAKNTSKGLAVLFLNAATNHTRKLTIDLAAHGIAAGAKVRDVWAKKDLPPLASTTYTTQAIPQIDSQLLLFSRG